MKQPRLIMQGRYALSRELGRGSGGVVYLAYDRLRRSRVVLKLLRKSPHEGALSEQRESFHVLTRLKHPALPNLFDWGIDGETSRMYYTKEYVHGQAGDRVAGTLSPGSVARLARALAEALSMLHRRGYCHGDLKPHNLLLRGQGAEVEGTLIDFGLIFRPGKVSRGVRGTSYYIAPEVLLGEIPSRTSDIYAFGAMLYHLLYGRPPFADRDWRPEDHGLTSPASSERSSPRPSREMLVTRILNDDPESPPKGWSPQIVEENGRELEAAQALDALIVDMMSRDTDVRRRTFEDLSSRLKSWTPLQAEVSSGAFVSRTQQVKRMVNWALGCAKTTDGLKPLMWFWGPKGVGRSRLLSVVEAELREHKIALLKHQLSNNAADSLLEDVARQMLIAYPDAIERRADLLDEIGMRHPSDEIALSGGQDARRQRLLGHLVQATRRQPMILVVHGLTAKHRVWKTLVALGRHFRADALRKAGERSRLGLVVVATDRAEDFVEGEQEAQQLWRTELSRVSREFQLKPFDLLEVERFLHDNLPPSARPKHIDPILRITGGLPARLVELVRHLIHVWRQGQPPALETLEAEGGLERLTQTRLEQQTPSALAVFGAVVLLERSLQREELEQLLPEYQVTAGLMRSMTADGLLTRVDDDINFPGYCLSKALDPSAAQYVPLLKAPGVRRELAYRMAQLLIQEHDQRASGVEVLPVDALRYLYLAQQWDTLAVHGRKVALEHVEFQRYDIAAQVVTWALEALDALHRMLTASTSPKQPEPLGVLSRRQPTSQSQTEFCSLKWLEAEQEYLLLVLLNISNKTEHFPDVEETGCQLIKRWQLQGRLETHFVEAFLDTEQTRDAMIALDWSEQLRRVPGHADDTQGNFGEEIARVLGLMVQSSLRGQAHGTTLHRAWLLLEKLLCSQTTSSWLVLFRSLARVLWNTSFRAEVLAAVDRLSQTKHIFQRMELDEQAACLNLRAALLEVEGKEEKALRGYEAASGMIPGSGMALSIAVPLALLNLARLFTMQQSLDVARYHSERALRLVEAQGFLSLQSSLMRNIADIHSRAGRPYEGMIAVEESYRLAISSGDQNAYHRTGRSLVFHYGEFGLVERVQDLYEQLTTDSAPDWALELNYVGARLSWGDVVDARHVLDRAVVMFGVDSLAPAFKMWFYTMNAELMLKEGQPQHAIAEARLGLEIASAEGKLQLVRLQHCIVSSYLQLGELEEAEYWLKRLEDFQYKTRISKEEVNILYIKGQLAQARGKLLDARQCYAQAYARLKQWLSDMPDAYREGYLRSTLRSAIVQAAQESRSWTERDSLFKDMRRVLSIVQALQSRVYRDLNALLERTLDEITEFTGADRGVIFHMEPRAADEELDEGVLFVLERDWSSKDAPDGWAFRIALASGFEERDLTQRALASRTVLRRVLQEGHPVISANAFEDRRFSQSGSIVDLGTRSILVIPLRHEAQINGLVYLDSREGEQFTQSDLELLSMLGDQLGTAVQSAQHRQQLRSVSKTFPRILGQSDALLSVLAAAEKVANTTIPVLIQGETGTGKDLLAKGLHEASSRVRGPFIAINCAALPESLIEGELFGAARGAYTGATQDRAGLFERAHGGTLFLDEIGDLPLAAQAKLLRVLEEGVVRRLGDERERSVDVRVITATHWELRRLVAEGQFREDLFYRLSVVSLRLPSLRERREDIPTLVLYFYNLFIDKHKLTTPPPSSELLAQLQEDDWPGNIRQLRNDMEKAMIFSQGGALTLEAFRASSDAPGIYSSVPGQPLMPPNGLAGGQMYGWASMPPGYAAPAVAYGQPPNHGYAAVRPPYGYPPWAQPTPYGGAPWTATPWGWGSPQGPWVVGPPPGQQWTDGRSTVAAPGWPAGPQQPVEGWSSASERTAGPSRPEEERAPASPRVSGHNGAAPQSTGTLQADGTPSWRVALDYQGGDLSEALWKVRVQMVRRALEATQGNKSQAAQMLGISRRTFYKILEQLDE